MSNVWIARGFVSLTLSPGTARVEQEMVKAVEVKLTEATERMSVPPWPRAAVAASPAAMQTQLRRFGRAMRMLRSLAAFDGAIPAGTLRALALDSIFSRQARSGSCYFCQP